MINWCLWHEMIEASQTPRGNRLLSHGSGSTRVSSLHSSRRFFPSLHLAVVSSTIVLGLVGAILPLDNGGTV